jgi:hypothetical protein
VACGDTFLLFEDEIGVKPHLHIVISEPDPEGRVVLVSVTTRRPKSDSMVCLESGDHDFIDHSSVISYSYAKILSLDQLKALVSVGDASARKPVTAELLARVQRGMLETDRAPREVQNFFKANFART